MKNDSAINCILVILALILFTAGVRSFNAGVSIKAGVRPSASPEKTVKAEKWRPTTLEELMPQFAIKETNGKFVIWFKAWDSTEWQESAKFNSEAEAKFAIELTEIDLKEKYELLDSIREALK